MKSFFSFIKNLKPKKLSVKIDESLTIPQNENDKLETELYKKLEKNYEHSDRIVRWYRNAKKQGVDETELKRTFIDNLVNIKDLFKTYEKYIEQLKKNKMLNKKVVITAGSKKLEFDPVRDVDKIRRLEGFQMFVKSIGDMVHSSLTVDTDKQKYAITDGDRKHIRLVGFTQSVMCWCTEGYETTNKFIYQLWQNDKTLGRGDVYGDPKTQTPYCTHSKQHWDDYANEYEKYQQFWFVERPDNRMTYAYDAFLEQHDDAKELLKNVNLQVGDLTNENVVYMFRLLKGLGPDGLIAMNDTGNDLLNRYDEHVTNISDLPHSGEVRKLSDEIFRSGSQSTITVGGVQVHLKHTDALLLKTDSPDGYTGGGIAIDGDDYDYQNIDSLNGCPSEVSGSFSIYRLPNVHSLDGCPKSVVGSFTIREVPIESLEGCPEIKVDKRHKEISIARTDIRNLKGIDPEFDGQIEIFNNEKFSSFEGTPRNCWLTVEDENIESLHGIPDKFHGSLDLSLPKLKSLDYAPSVCHVFALGNNDNISYEELQEYKRYREFGSLIQRIDVEGLKQKLQYWYDIHTMPDGDHYRQKGPTQDEAATMSVDELKELLEATKNTTNESTIDEVETSKTASYKFEVKIADNIQKFIAEQTAYGFVGLEVHHYEDSDSKYHSDIYIENPRNGKQVWIEAKKNKYANLGSSSFKYIDGKWSCTTLSEDEPLAELYLNALEDHASDFISFCKEFLGKDDVQIPKDLTEDLVKAWKDSGKISDTENDVQFITDKIQLDGFGEKISEFYKTAKEEPVHYIQIADDLYIIDPEYNPLGIVAKDGSGLMSLSEAYRIGRIQFRLKGQHHTSVSGEDVVYYSIFLDVKILSDKENDTSMYSCSFLTPEKFPVVEDVVGNINEAEKDIGGDASDFNVEGKKIWIDDTRVAPDGFKWIKTVNDFIDYAHENGVSDVQLFDVDHDAGEFVSEGGNYVVCFQYLEKCGVKNVLVHIHSSNPVGANNIRKIITRNKENGWREIRNSN